MSSLQVVADDAATPSPLLGALAQNDSKGCGAVMRTAPFGWIPCDRSDFSAWIVPSALKAAGYTHGHVTGQVSAAALTLMIHQLICDLGLDASIVRSIQGIERLDGADETVQAFKGAVRSAKRFPRDQDVLESLGQGWTAEEALAISVYCALSFPEEAQILDALSLGVSHSGDSDSTGSICGNILGALHGVEALPTYLLSGLEGLSAIKHLGEEFVRTFAPGKEAMFTA